jgi:preprotein translocase subunit SecY
MNIPFLKKSNTPNTTPKHKKDGRINPHTFWTYFIIVFVFVLIVVIILFTYFFIISSRSLDKEVAPKLDTNIGQIKRIEQSIQKTEESISERQGIKNSLEDLNN